MVNNDITRRYLDEEPRIEAKNNSFQPDFEPEFNLRVE